MDNCLNCKFLKDKNCKLGVKIINIELVCGQHKEEKVEKIVVRGWEDLDKYVKVNLGVMRTFRLSDVEFTVLGGQIEKAVKILNVLGGNFEYKKVDVIDNYDKFREFLDKSKLAMWAEEGKFWFSESTDKAECKDYTVDSLQYEFNVDLKILK